MGTQQRAQPRLMIREMVLENFKSYAGAQSVGPFHKCFSSVVGPNGSGKSNVIDAMLFVFGKRAKQLRLNKVSELIHNSTHHRDLEMARVSVHFQEIIDLDDENFDVVPGSGFVVSRTAHRNNKSDYYINDRRSNFTEVTELLKGKGIDLDNNRFLILQGEVEQISMMKPKGATEHETGLLEYLEDIVGTDRYVPAIAEGAKELEALNERRQGVVQRVKLAERERDALEGEKAAAEAYLERERQCLGAQNELAQLFARDARRNVAKIERNLCALEERLSHEKAKHAQHAAVLEQHEARYNGVVEEHTAIQAELDAANAEFKEFERKDIKYREDLKHGKAKLKKLEERLQRDGQRLATAERDIGALEAEVPALQGAAAAAAEALATAEQKLEGLAAGCREAVEGLRSQLRGVRAELAPWEASMTEVQGRIDVAASERDLLLRAHDEAVARLADARAALKAAKEAAAARRAAAADQEAQAAQHAAAGERARAAAGAASSDVARLEAAAREVRGRAEQRRADATSRASAGAVVQALMEARASGAIAGIHGRLGDLGAVDARYDVAASTAAPALDYIVVDTTSTAQRCVELLRQRQLGVATFLILEKQQHLAGAAREVVSPPEGVPRLFDLVRARDGAASLAFYFAMRDTLVAGDLEQAARIAYSGDRRWRRVVTVRGEMINESGTMSGGGGKPRGGRMCLGSAAPRVGDAREAAAELRDAEAELEAAAAELQGARATLAEASAAAKQAERALAALETSIPKTRMEAEAAAASARDLEQRMAELEAATEVSAADVARLKALEPEIKAASKELAALQARSAALAGRAAELEQAIEDAGGEELKRQRALVARLQREIAAAESEATKKGVQAGAAAKQADKLRRELAKAAAEREALAAAQASAMAEFKTLEDAAFRVLEVVRSTQGVLAAKAAELGAIRSEYEARQREVSVIRQVEVDITNEAELQRIALREEGAKLKHWAAKAADHGAAIAERDGLGAPPPPLTEAQLAGADAQELQYRVTVLEEEMARMAINVDAIDAWRKADSEYGARVGELEAATAARDGVRRAHEELRKRRLDEFMAGFNSISLKLKEMYQMITMGGDAELELVDSLDPFAEGILFSVRPPKKSWKNIANLSGGEKTLSSLSLVFALHHYKPTPLYVMDEIDAALDFKNVSIVGHYIKERTKNAQFVIISLRNNMFELADRLVGIYKTDNATKSVAINPGQFVVGARGGGAGCGATAAAGSGDQQLPPGVETA